MPFLIGARLLQGVGGALLAPGSLALIQATYRPEDRAKAIGAWSGLGGVGHRHRTVPRRLAGGRGQLALGLLPQSAAGRTGDRGGRCGSSRRAATTVPSTSTWRVPRSAPLGLAGVTYALVEAPDQGASPVVLGAV